MTAMRLLQKIESWGVRLSLRASRLVVTGKPSTSTKQLIGLHRKELIDALRGTDTDLSVARGRTYLESIGAFQMPLRTGFERGRGFTLGGWTHSLGDEHLERILCGEIDFEQATRDHAEATACAERQLSEMQTGHLRPF